MVPSVVMGWDEMGWDGCDGQTPTQTFGGPCRGLRLLVGVRCWLG